MYILYISIFVIKYCLLILSRKISRLKILIVQAFSFNVYIKEMLQLKDYIERFPKIDAIEQEVLSV